MRDHMKRPYADRLLHHRFVAELVGDMISGRLGDGQICSSIISFKK